MPKELYEYLGDSVYADFDGYHVVLTTNNGFGPSNAIYLEPSVIKKLTEYVESIPERIKAVKDEC